MTRDGVSGGPITIRGAWPVDARRGSAILELTSSQNNARSQTSLLFQRSAESPPVDHTIVPECRAARQVSQRKGRALAVGDPRRTIFAVLLSVYSAASSYGRSGGSGGVEGCISRNRSPEVYCQPG
jgi:hypothetical protein